MKNVASPETSVSSRVEQSGKDLIGEYDMAEVCARIEEKRITSGVSIRDLTKALGIHHYDYSRKIRREKSSFSLREISMIAFVFGARVGWPFLDDALLDKIEKKGGRLPVVRQPREEK